MNKTLTRTTFTPGKSPALRGAWTPSPASEGKPIIIVNSSGGFFYTNYQFLQLLGYEAGELKNQHFFDLLYHYDVQNFIDAFLQLLKFPNVHSSTVLLHMKSKSGSTLSQWATVTLIQQQTEEYGLRILFRATFEAQISE